MGADGWTAAFAAPLRGARLSFGALTQGFTLHPTDKDLSAGTPALGYSPFPPGGGAGLELTDVWVCDWSEPPK
jgi:hypothetical protein